MEEQYYKNKCPVMIVADSIYCVLKPEKIYEDGIRILFPSFVMWKEIAS